MQERDYSQAHAESLLRDKDDYEYMLTFACRELIEEIVEQHKDPKTMFVQTMLQEKEDFDV